MMLPAPTLSRRRLLRGAIAAAGLGLGARLPLQAAPAPLLIDVWKSPSCGCCRDWITHLQGHGFQARAHDVGNAGMRARLKVAPAYGSCHTALVGDYAIEGHVPARDILRLLKEKPDALGLAVPGMPIGSPGMDGPEYGGRRDAYEVLLLARDGSASVYARYAGVTPGRAPAR